MIKNCVRKLLVVFFVWNCWIAATSYAVCKAIKVQQAPQTRALSLPTSLTAVTDVLQNVAKAVVKLGPLLNSVGAATDPMSAISILGQAIQAAADMQKQQEATAPSFSKAKQEVAVCETRSKKSCGCPCLCEQEQAVKTKKTRSFQPHVSPMDMMMNLVIKTAQLPGVTDKSSLWILKSGVVRTPPQVLFQQMMGHTKSRKKLLRDFCVILRGRAIAELESKENSTARNALSQALLPLGAILLVPLVNLLIDIVQKIMNKYVDDVQADMNNHGAVGADEALQLSPEVLDGLNNVIDSIQDLANTAIDVEQVALAEKMEQKPVAQ